MAQNSIEEITYAEYITRRQNYLDYNARIGKGHLSDEPVVVYFDKEDVVSILDDNPTYLTFMFTCDDNTYFTNLNAMMCGMKVMGVPQNDSKIFKGYAEKDPRVTPISKDQFEEGRLIFDKRLNYYNDTENWHGVKHEDPISFKDVLDKESVKKLAIYFGVKDDKYGVMLVPSEEGFSDQKLTENSTKIQVYNNGNQCCI